MKCVKILRQQNVIAYPTESMFGLGCDPSSKNAVDKLLNLKKRKIDKGFILVASDYNQVQMYLNEKKISCLQKKKMFLHWPGPVTFVVPASTLAPFWITGKFNTVAIRISKHIPIIQLCRMFGKAIVSTSANVSSMPPC
ncbi:MAG: Sua5/YciO/YrdC/YwlC family protein, partial [Buchnera aphidicola]|nr:Sua5/YciO/YrdC/YwlC family protein [Buchnera aphidicola]